MNIYVGNLAFSTTEDDLRSTFSAYGAVSTARMAVDRDTGRNRGFGFVEMPERNEANAAIAGLNGKELAGRTLTVNEARPREEGSRSGGNGNRGGGDFGGGRSRW